MNESKDSVAMGDIRWGAAALALGAILFVIGVVLGLQTFSGNWDRSVGATLPDTASLIQERWPRFRAIWSVELLAALLMSSAAFLLQRRSQGGSRWMPNSAVWVVVGIGSIIVAVSYALTLGSYPSALAAFTEEPAVFTSLRGGILFLHMTGSILQLLGLLAALFSEFRWKGREMPDRIVHVAAGMSLLGILAGIGGLIPPELGAAPIFLAGAALGLAIWMKAGRPA